MAQQGRAWFSLRRAWAHLGNFGRWWRQALVHGCPPCGAWLPTASGQGGQPVALTIVSATACANEWGDIEAVQVCHAAVGSPRPENEGPEAFS